MGKGMELLCLLPMSTCLFGSSPNPLFCFVLFVFVCLVFYGSFIVVLVVV